MKNRDTNYRTYIYQVLTAIISLFFILTGCAGSRVKPETSKSIDKSNELTETVEIRFERPLIIRTPEAAPVSAKQHIQTALFYFENGKYLLAAEEFDNARQGIADKGKLYRNCLIAIAVCKLLLDDKAGFIKSIDELKGVYSSYELMVIKDKDKRIKALFNLYDGFKNNGNY
ncbi:MAG TPA: hypothetical protein ENG83_13030 [Nitrospirae bacterium]|nr:hypothetical protein BMS3Abin06_00713 [bacterium BMS3Abin06]HDH13101.1 hypothetical protein [Nitrospirota bacterium]HDZ02115.1 hypothetical protein [Nitrospirota bacterium]